MGSSISATKKQIKNDLAKKLQIDTFEKGNEKLQNKHLLGLLDHLIKTKNKSVTHFHLTTDKLTDEDAILIEEMLKNYTADSTGRVEGSLSLAFKRTQFTAKGLACILRSLEYCDVVGSLTLHGNNNDVIFEKSLVETLGNSLKKNNSLIRLDICNYIVPQETLDAFCNIMNEQKTVLHLVLSGWNFTAKNIKDLLTGSSFEYLDFTNCKFNDECCKSLAEVLKDNVTLRKVVLEENEITDEGVEYLIQEMEYNTKTQVTAIVVAKNPGIKKEDTFDRLSTALQFPKKVKKEEKKEKDDKQSKGDELLKYL